MRSRWWDRVLGAVLLLVALAFIAGAARLQVPFQYEPLGPKAFPIVLGTLLAICGVVLTLRPDTVEWFDSRAAAWRVLAGALLLCLYAALFEPLGFILSTALAVTAMSRLFGLSVGPAALYGVALAVIGYFGVGEGMGLNLPAGDLFVG